MKYTRSFALLFALTSAAACSGGSEQPSGTSSVPAECTDANKPGCVIASSKERISKPNVAQADQTSLASGNTAFALDLYQQVRSTPGNLFYSPFSISMALAMTWAGARSDTETAMAKTLHFAMPQDKLHPAFNWLDQELASRGEGAAGSDDQGFRLKVTNALWGQVGYTFEAPFLDTLAEDYGAGMHIVDFAGDAPGSVNIINGWVKENTEGKIPKLLPPENITEETVLVLTNAIYFNAAWNEPFKVENTKDGSFEKLDATKVTVPMMSSHHEMNYSEGAGFKAVSLPYDGDELSMLIILPDAGTLDSFEASLDGAKLDSMASSMKQYLVDIKMPKFKIEYALGLKKALEAMGMGVAFKAGAADFTGMNAKGQPYIQDVIHKAFVSVDENGTEAAAATAVVVGDGAAPEMTSISLDHPFLFMIRDNPTGSVLFVGRVEDPSSP